MARDQNENTMRYKRGFIVCYEDDSIPISRRMCVPDFFVINCGDIDEEQVRAYLESWKKEIDYTVLAHQVPTDGYRIKVFGSKTSIQEHGVNYGRIKKVDVQSTLENWGCSIYQTTTNEVTFDFYIHEMIQSNGFWQTDADLSGIVWTELNYDETTGMHRIQCDYSGTSFSEKKIESNLKNRIDPKQPGYNGDQIVSHENNVVVFDMNRNLVLQHFKNKMKDKVVKHIMRRFQYLDLSYCNSILSAIPRTGIVHNYGTIIITDDPTGFSVGDKVSVYNLNGIRGWELAIITNISGNNIYVDRPLTGNYIDNSYVIKADTVYSDTKANILANLKSKLTD